MSKHTDGPWLLVEKEQTRGAHDTQPHLEYFHIQGPQGDLDPNLRIAGFMKRGDAKLIAAAPELLEACMTMAEWFRREKAGFGKDRSTAEGEAQWREWWDEQISLCDRSETQANAAIAKATDQK